MNTSKKYPGHLALLAANVFFGLNMVVSKNLMNEVVSPLGLNALRFLAGTSAFWVLSLFLKPEKVAKKDLLGVLVGGTGAVYLIMSSSQGAGHEGNLIGDLLCFGSTIAFSLFLVVTKPITQKYSAVTVMKWLFLFAGVVVIPFSYNNIKAVDFTGMTTNNGLSLAFTLVFATIIPYLILPIGQKRLRPTTQSMYNYVLPIVTFVVAVVAGTNSMTVPKGIATALIFVGVYIVTRSKSRADVEAALVSNKITVKAMEKN